MRPTLRNLNYLIALQKHQHFSKAAKECCVSPSTFSAGISKLEKGLGNKLVERSNRHVNFTSLGNHVVNQAKLIIDEVNTLSEIAKLDFFESEISIGIIPTISTYLLPNFLSRINKNYPNMKVAFRENTSGNLLQLLEESEIDFAIFAFPYDLPTTVEHKEVFCDPIFPIRHKKRNKYTLEDESLLLLDQGHCLRSQILNNNDILSRHIANFSCTSISTLVAMVDMDLGVSFLPKMAIDYGVINHYPNITADSEYSKVNRGIGVIYRKNSQSKKNILELAKLLKDS